MVYSCTNWHIVDEDLTAISVHGGGWSESIRVGAARRTMNDTSTAVGDVVASRCCTIQTKKINITHLLTRVSDDKLHFHLC